jgi:hypothetical protein
MSGAIQKPEYKYVAYIDESGDPGLKRVKPLDARGSSKWLIVAGVVINADREADVSSWVREDLNALKSRQLKDIHFAKLNRPRRLIMCDQVASRPLRCFVVASNKKNMRGYNNPDAAKVPSDNWFYCWLTRVLLERITLFVAADSMIRYGEVKRVKIEYSERGGLRYGQMAAYYEWLRDKSRADSMFLKAGDLVWETIHSHLLEVWPHETRAGLKLPDTVAGAFFQAADCLDSGPCDSEYAKRLEPRMARVPDIRGGQIAGFGLKLLPGLRAAKLSIKQEEIFRFYGYPKQWWAPDPSAPKAF